MEERRAMLFAVSAICEAEATKDCVNAEYDPNRRLRPTLTSEAVQILTEVAMKQLELVAYDVQHFAHHAGRRTISPEDILLCARRQMNLMSQLQTYQRNTFLAQPKKRKRQVTD
ncbi:unnamed protein product [Aphanomyces euteiches]|uniref:Centromere protein S n=1 Tax=Aphanomyces euteiches TaxID=100861 RepID=A0A6G0X4I1_9STRA|nr:hypothetical protein Ae201684_008655 [Aphanomyces euteiches]KAH9086060.1 hypothetical protein Ae201684P_005756 [Aphanomyces euteiches]